MLNAKDPLTGEGTPSPPPSLSPSPFLSFFFSLCSIILIGLDDQNMRYQMVTFLIAGHETTSGLLTFALYELLQHPDILAKAREEVDKVLGCNMPRPDDLPKLQYLDQVLKETLRLWPTAPAFAVYAQ